MVLKMPRPGRRKDGTYYLRVRIPADLRAAFQGKGEHKESLGTRNPEKAERRFAERLRAFREKCENLRKGPEQLSERDAQRIATQVFSRWCAKYRDNPSSQTEWRPGDFSEIGRQMTYPGKTADFVSGPGQAPYPPSVGVPGLMDFSMKPARSMERIAAKETKKLAEDQGLTLDSVSYQKLERAVTVAIQRACLTLEKWANGEVDEFGITDTLDTVIGDSPKRIAKSVDFMDLFNRWEREALPKARTAYEWRSKLIRLEKDVGFTDACRLTRDDVVLWKDCLYNSGLAAKTVNDSYLTAVRTVLQWGVANGLIPANPAAGVRVRQKEKLKGIRGFSDKEARAILSAAASAIEPEKRWIPLLLCYSGARLTEISQLRSEDIEKHDGFFTMSLAFEAGSLKTKGSERIVPLHPAVVAAGFIDFVSHADAGPLFFGLRVNKFGNRGGTATKVLGAWVRELGVDDERVSPNHSWRHRFKTQARQCGIPANISDAITGHAFKTEGNSYGTYSSRLMYNEIEKLPTIEV